MGVKRATKQCYSCKQVFRREELVDYASPRAKNLQSYCPKCLKEKQEKDKFTDAVCFIFGIKMPGGRIWRDRRNLIDQYGYTDQTIIDCLDYLYNVKKMKKLSESLYLINPPIVNEMLQYKKQQAVEAQKLASAMQQKEKEFIVPVQKKKKQIKKVEYDPDEWLDD